MDGALLCDFLLSKGYEVYGTFRRLSTPNFWRLQALGIHLKVKLISMDLGDMSSILEALTVSRPDEVYHQASQSFVGSSFDQPLMTGDLTGLAATRLLEALRLVAKDTRLYQASSSEMYGNSTSTQNENTPFKPRSPYATAKLYAYWMARIYRQSYGMFVCNGILFNHESPLRGLEFVTRKTSNAVARISLGLQQKVLMGNLKAERDWGYAPDYVRCMWMILQQEKPDDYVVATGRKHTVKQFVDEAFGRANLPLENHVIVDRKLMRPMDVDSLCGDASKAKSILGWKPEVGFKELVSLMVDKDIERWKMWQQGKVFAWDAPNYPEDLRIISTRYSLDR